MIRGARQLPTMHVSVRVPWHDSRWVGKICVNPRGNTSCLILPRIAETKDDDFEADHATADWSPDGARLPACAAERGAFRRMLLLLSDHHRLRFATSHSRLDRTSTNVDHLRSLFNIHLTETGRDRARGPSKACASTGTRRPP